MKNDYNDEINSMNEFDDIDYDDRYNSEDHQYISLYTQIEDIVDKRKSDLSNRAGQDLECAIEALADEIMSEYATCILQRDELIEFIRDQI